MRGRLDKEDTMDTETYIERTPWFMRLLGYAGQREVEKVTYAGVGGIFLETRVRYFV